MQYIEFIELVRQNKLSIQDICQYFKGSNKTEIKDTLFKMFASAENISDEAMTISQEERYTNVLNAIASIEEHYKVSLFDYDILGGKVSKNFMPRELKTDYFMQVLNKLKERKFMIEVNGEYEWKYTENLLAYFIDQVTDKMQLKASNGRVPWNLFRWIKDVNPKKLSKSKSEYTAKEGRSAKPRGTKLIDEILGI